jgi:hypothetical protein
MFAEYIVVNNNEAIKKVDFLIQNDSYYKSANSNGLVIINTPLASVYINDDSYFSNVPESAWMSVFKGELSPQAFLESKIGQPMTNESVIEFQKLINDLIDAEFSSKDV